MQNYDNEEQFGRHIICMCQNPRNVQLYISIVISTITWDDESDEKDENYIKLASVACNGGTLNPL